MRITFFFLLLPFLAWSQPGKIAYKSGVFSIKWQIDGQQVKPDAVRLHLERYSPKAATDFAFMRRAQRNGRIWDIVGAVGIVGLAVSKTPVPVASFAAVGVAGCTGLIVCNINEKKHRKRAISAHNKTL